MRITLKYIKGPKFTLRKKCSYVGLAEIFFFFNGYTLDEGAGKQGLTVIVKNVNWDNSVESNLYCLSK